MLWRNPNELLANPMISFLVDMLETSLLLPRLASVFSPETSLFSGMQGIKLPLQALLMVETGLSSRLSGRKLARVSRLDCWLEENWSWKQCCYFCSYSVKSAVFCICRNDCTFNTYDYSMGNIEIVRVSSDYLWSMCWIVDAYFYACR